MTDKMREEFEAAYVEEMVRIMGEGIRKRAVDNTRFLMQNGEFHDPALRLALWAWQAPRETPAIHPLQQCLRDNGDLIAAQATIAQQAQMIEHLRGGPTPGYTAADMTTAAAQGFRDGAAHFNPDWDRLEAAQESLREHMEIIRRLKAENDELITALNEILRVTPLGVEAFGIAALVLGELGVSKEVGHG